MKKLLFLNMVLCLLITHAGFAQQLVTLRGKVLDETGAPVAGVSIGVEGTATATATNESGDFTMEYTPPATLHFTALGYIEQSLDFTGQTTLTVRLVPTQETLDEVVVVGYGTQRKGEVTSAIASVKSEDFVK